MYVYQDVSSYNLRKMSTVATTLVMELYFLPISAGRGAGLLLALSCWSRPWTMMPEGLPNGQ